MSWNELPDSVQTDLIEWFNVSEPNDEDLERLAELYEGDRFHAWNCPTCGARVQQGEPHDWRDFQGVNQPDLCSYPGSPEVYTAETISKQCDDCRMSGV